MRGTVQFDGDISSNFEVKSGVKQGCMLARYFLLSAQETCLQVFHWWGLPPLHIWQLTSQGYVPSQRAGHSTSETNCLLTMQLSSFTQKDSKSYKRGWPTPEINLALQSALGRSRLWDRPHQPSLFWKLLGKLRSCLSVPLSWLYSDWHLVSGGGNQQAHRYGLHYTAQTRQECWENKNLKIPTKVNVYKPSVISTLFCMAVNLGQRIPLENGSFRLFT